MKVAILADKLNIDGGGSNFSLDLLARQLTKRDYDITVITYNFGNENNLPETYEYKIRHHPTSTNKFRTARQIYESIDDLTHEHDVIHVFNPAIIPIVGLRRRKIETPVVGRLNNYRGFCTNTAKMDGVCHEACSLRNKYQHSSRGTKDNVINIPKYAFDTWAMPRLLNSVDRLFALSPAVQSIYSDIGASEDVIEVIPNFYDPSFWLNDDLPDTDEKRISILYVGSLAKHKGVDLIIKATEKIDTPVNVDIVGDGSQLRSLKKLSSNIDSCVNIQFHGRIPNSRLPIFYNKSDIFVHPGYWPEPFARTLLEAMQFNCACIVSDIGGPPWVIGNCGESFPRGSIDDLARKLNKFIDDDDLRSKYQQNCTGHIERFSPKTVISQIEDQYLSLLS